MLSLLTFSLFTCCSINLAAAPIKTQATEIQKLVEALVDIEPNEKPKEIIQRLKLLNEGRYQSILAEKLLKSLPEDPYGDYLLEACYSIGPNKYLFEGLQKYEQQFFKLLKEEYFAKQKVFFYQLAIGRTAPNEQAKMEMIDARLKNLKFDSPKGSRRAYALLQLLSHTASQESLDRLLRIARNEKLTEDSVEFRVKAIKAIGKMFQYAKSSGNLNFDVNTVNKLKKSLKELKKHNELVEQVEDTLFEIDSAVSMI